MDGTRGPGAKLHDLGERASEGDAALGPSSSSCDGCRRWEVVPPGSQALLEYPSVCASRAVPLGSRKMGPGGALGTMVGSRDEDTEGLAGPAAGLAGVNRDD